MSRTNEPIWDRWEEILARVNVVLEVEELSATEREFLYSMHSRLNQFRHKTFVSAKQLNWLSDLEAKYNVG